VRATDRDLERRRVAEYAGRGHQPVEPQGFLDNVHRVEIAASRPAADAAGQVENLGSLHVPSCHAPFAGHVVVDADQFLAVRERLLSHVLAFQSEPRAYQ